MTQIIGLVCWGLMPQQQPGLYQGDEDDEMSVSLVEETGVPGGVTHINKP